MKTQEQILQRIKDVEKDDWMGTQSGDLIDFLDWENAKQYLKPEATKEEWDAREIKPPMEQAKDYLEFAWGKANDCRGLSAGRSLEHLITWLWLAGYEDIIEHFSDYSHYGKKQLVIASLICGFDWRAHDNGKWVNDESTPSMSREGIEAEAKAAAALVESRKAA